MTLRRSLLLIGLLSLPFVCWARGVPEGLPETLNELSSWDLELEDLKLEDGEAIILEFPAGGVSRTVFGTGTYSSHSSISNAAVHAGLISIQDGGSVTILVRNGLDYYAGSSRNGITSVMGGRSDRSFVFLDNNMAIFPVALEIAWDFCPVMMPAGSRIRAQLPPGGKDYFVFGSGPYDVYSAVGAAAVHAGLISFHDGGTVYIEVSDSPPEQAGSVAHGVRSSITTGGDKSFQFILP